MEYLQESGIRTELFDRRKGVQCYDAIIVSKSLQPKTLELARAAKAAGKRLIFDICDNLFEAKETLGKRLKVERLREMFLLADVVIRCRSRSVCA